MRKSFWKKKFFQKIENFRKFPDFQKSGRKKVTFFEKSKINFFFKKKSHRKKNFFENPAPWLFFNILVLLKTRGYDRIDARLTTFIRISKIEIFDFPEILEIFVGVVSKNGGFEIFENLDFWIPC